MAKVPSHRAHNLIFLLLAFCACARSNDVENIKDVETIKIEDINTQKAEQVAETIRQKSQVS